jgi:hypothetical protein
MDYKYKQLEQELSALAKAFGELGALLSSTAKEVTAPGVVPPDKLIEQIASARAGFDQVRGAIHAHAALMLVNPLPKAQDLNSIGALESLLKASSAAEENKYSLEGEREKALGILDRVLAIAHKEIPDFKPLQEHHAKVAELRAAVDKVFWPHRHPEAEAVNELRHAATALLTFVENLETLEDERWIALEAVITENYGKPLFVAASRGKLISGPSAASTPAPAAAKPVPAAAVAAEKPAPAPPVEKKVVVEKPAPAPKPAPVPAAAVAEKRGPVVVSAPPPAATAPAAPAATAQTPGAAVNGTPAPAAVPASTAPAQSAPPTAAPAAPRPANQPQPASAIHSLTALATATEPAPAERKTPPPPPADISERQRKEPRLATTAAPPAARPAEPKPQEPEIAPGDPSRAVAGDPSQRPQRWGFWRGNR